MINLKKPSSVVKSGNMVHIDRLIEAGADENSVNVKAESLACAAHEGKKGILEYIIKKGADVNATSHEEDTALHRAVGSGNLRCVRLLLDAGADVNSLDDWRITPLMHAAIEGQSQCIDLLIKAGANLELSNRDGDTALMKAARCNQLKCLELLIKLGANVHATKKGLFTALHCAAMDGPHKVMKLLVKAGANVNATDSHKLTPLMLAAGHGDVHMLHTLLAAGADVNASSMGLGDALHYAAEKDQHECLDVLIKAGADVNKNDQYPCLINAAMYGSWKCMKLLLEAGAHVNAIHDRSTARSTALVDAAKHTYPKCVGLLIQAGVDVNIQDESGMTALIFSAWVCNPRDMNPSIKNIKLLLAAGAHVNLVNNDNQNALQYHIAENDPDKTSETMAMLLYVAGETIDGSTVERCGPNVKVNFGDHVQVPEYLLNTDSQLCLKESCRVAIRKHLLNADPKNLFTRIPQLGLPSPLQQYLLYNITLDMDISVKLTTK